MKAFVREIALRFWVTVLLYVAVIALSFYLAYELRFDFQVPKEFQDERLRLLKYAVVVKFLCLVVLRQTGSMLRYFSIPDLVRVTMAMGLGSLLLIAPRLSGIGYYVYPRGVLLIDLVLSVAGLCAFRVLLRVYQERTSIAHDRKQEEIIIVGAGDSGASLAKELLGRPSRGLKPVAFLDDDTKKRGRLVHGVPVLGRAEELTSQNFPRAQTVVVAMPSAPQKRVREIVLHLAQKGYKVEIIPAIEDLASGRAKASHLRAVEVEDLLGREPVQLDTSAIRRFVEGKVVMVTGAGGSIGSELCRQIAHLNPQRLLMVERSEVSLFTIEQQMNELALGALATPLVADVLDAPRMEGIFERLRPQVVFHAAAHKHVYLMERQPGEAIRNNSTGSRLLGEMAMRFGVESFVLISTDKAINPTSLMGASKRLAEIHLQALQARSVRNPSRPIIVAAGSGTEISELGSAPIPGTATKFVAVRFGNVLGSSGSVVPIFKRQIAAGGPVTVTHPDVVRYFMTIPEAVGLVMQAAVLGKGGEIFVLDMGQPVKIADLARQMIELSGLKVGEDIEIKFVGLKPGEKLYEELQHDDESHIPTEHERIFSFVPKSGVEEASARALDQLEPILASASPNAIKQQLKVVIPEYTPHLE